MFFEKKPETLTKFRDFRYFPFLNKTKNFDVFYAGRVRCIGTVSRSSTKLDLGVTKILFHSHKEIQVLPFKCCKTKDF